jgi:glycerol uptake facilitator protein
MGSDPAGSAGGRVVADVSTAHQHQLRAAVCGAPAPPETGAGLRRRMLAEGLGTALLVAFGAGSLLAAKVAEPTPVGFAGLGFVALTFGFAVALAVYVVGVTSGAHINPAVTVALAAARRFPWRDVAPYLVAQLIGASIGALLLVAVFGTATATAASTGATVLGDGVGFGRGVLAEALGTFLLVLVVMALAVDHLAPDGWAGLGIGLAIATEILLIGPLTGGSVNPARTFGPYLANSLAGGSTPWSQLLVYIVGPLLGGTAAALTYRAVAPRNQPRDRTTAPPEASHT